MNPLQASARKLAGMLALEESAPLSLQEALQTERGRWLRRSVPEELQDSVWREARALLGQGRG